MPEITSDAVIGFAKQGHPQAIAVLLNRVLVPKGAHVKVRKKKELLKVLINFLRDTELEQLVDQVQHKFDELSPETVERVQIFTQRLGDKQASFQKEILITERQPVLGQDPQTASAHLSDAPLPQSPVHTYIQPTEIQETETQSQTPELSSISQNRYTVAEFLSQVSKIEELDVLKDHPFFTGVCPKCFHSYTNLQNPPLFWDCVACGWQDDLSQKVPTHLLRETPQRRKIRQGKRLGSYLIEAGLLTPAQIEVALADQQLAGMRLGEVLVRRGWIKEETVEYFMRKVVEPERASSGQAEAYLESSRNLLKTLIHSKDEEHKGAQVTSEPSSADSKRAEIARERQSDSDEPTAAKQPINSRETLILSDLDVPTPKSKDPLNAVNERETLLIPDIESSRLIDQDAD